MRQDGSAGPYLGQVLRSRWQVKFHGHKLKNIANEVGATSSEGFLVERAVLYILRSSNFCVVLGKCVQKGNLYT